MYYGNTYFLLLLYLNMIMNNNIVQNENQPYGICHNTNL